MNEPIEFPIFVVMRNGHIMPPGIHIHKVNAEATAVREHGIVVPLCPTNPSSSAMAAAREIAEEICKEIPAYDDATTKEEFDEIVKIIAKHMQIPEGWVLVPREPTPEMELAGKHTLKGATEVFERQQAIAVYKSMLRAAPPKGDGG